MNHYVYFITNEDKMKYLGVRSSECSPEEDTKYWGSSKYLPKDISETGVKEVVEVLDTREEAVALEIYLHDKWNVAVNPWFYNRAKQTSTGFDTQGCTKENHPGLAAMAEGKRGKPSWNKGIPHAEETKTKIAEKLKGRTKENDPGVAAQAEKMKGKRVSVATEFKKGVRNSISTEFKKGCGVGADNPTNQVKWLRTCEHCNRTMNKSHIKRWHNDNCKLKGGS